LVEADWALKTGKMEETLALDLLVVEWPGDGYEPALSPSQKWLTRMYGAETTRTVPLPGAPAAGVLRPVG